MLGVAVPVLAGGVHGPATVADVPPVVLVLPGVDVPTPLDVVVPLVVLPAVEPVVPTPVEVVPLPAVPQFAVVVAVEPEGVAVDWLGVVVVVVLGVVVVD